MSAPLERLRAVVLSYGSGGECVPLLEALIGEGMAAERILVVHNPSAPGEGAPPLPAGCELLLADRNLGYAAGMNRGIERQLARDGELLLLLTHDARLRPGTLAALLDAAESDRRYGLLGPALVFTGTEEPFSYGGTTGRYGTMAHRSERPSAPGGIAACDWIDGGTILARTEVLRRVGGFDERFWSYCEEADLCLRASRAGFLVGVLVDARADQDPGGSKRPGPWAYLLTRNGTAYARRAAGRRGVAAATARALWTVAFDLLRAALRRLRLRPGAPAEPWAVAIGTARGALDYFRGRWGPPPSLPGSGDVGNLDRGGGDDGGG